MTRARALLLAAGCAASLGSASVPAEAVVPPKYCGKIRANGRVYKVKADQISCKYAMGWARKTIETGRRPPGYSCKRLPRRSTFRLYCSRGKRLIIALKR